MNIKQIIPFILTGILFILNGFSESALKSKSIYYVSTSGINLPTRGAEIGPWATIGYALTQVPDESTILVKPGLYTGRVNLTGEFQKGVIVKSEIPYKAQLRNNRTVVTCSKGKGITLEGFDIAHMGPGASPVVVQIEDLIGRESGGEDYVSRIVLRNNILHDSYNNDILKINNGAGQITIEGNIFYNQGKSDEHIDINSVTDVIVQDNIFFNDFSGSGRENKNDSSSYIVIKDSNESRDTHLGAQRISVRRNVFLNWEGSNGTHFVLVGEDGKSYFEAQDVMVENNLMIGNSPNEMRAAFGVIGSKNITFRHNTVTGDLPSMAYAVRMRQIGQNRPIENVSFYNNIWSDPTGTMGAGTNKENDFSDTPPSDILSFILSNNLYWNDGKPIPFDKNEKINYKDDVNPLLSNPLLKEPTKLILPRWIPAKNQFADGSSIIREVFEKLVNQYAIPAKGSPVIDSAKPVYSPKEDILGNPRTQGKAPDIGCYEMPLNDSPNSTTSKK